MATIAEGSNYQPLRSSWASTDNPELVLPVNNGKHLSQMEKCFLNARKMALGGYFISSVDDFSFKIFPVAFIAYNVYYWMVLIL